MAEYQLTRKEFDALLDRPPEVRSWWANAALRGLVFVVVPAIVALTVYFRQWLFAGVFLVLVVFIIMLGRRMDRRVFEHDPFKARRVQVEILPDTIEIRADMNRVQFAYADLDKLLEYPRCFLVLDHSGLQVRVPRAALTGQELSVLVGLQNALPKIAKKMYTR